MKVIKKLKQRKMTKKHYLEVKKGLKEIKIKYLEVNEAKEFIKEALKSLKLCKKRVIKNGLYINTLLHYYNEINRLLNIAKENNNLDCCGGIFQSKQSECLNFNRSIEAIIRDKKSDNKKKFKEFKDNVIFLLAILTFFVALSGVLLTLFLKK